MIDKIVRARAAGSLALAIGVGAASHACQTTPGTPGGAPMCTYLEQIKCGPQNQCTSTCLLDLSAYGPCTCGDAGTDGGDGGKDAR